MNAGVSHIVSVDNLVKTYGVVRAVDGVSFSVRDGEFLTFLGSSGSGKTTTLFVVAGFEDATTGEVRIDGRSVLNVPPHLRNIGMVFQRYTLFPHLTVFDNIAFPLAIRGTDKRRIRDSVGKMLDLVQLSNCADRKPNQLSGGQQQRVALARALVYQPRLLLMDEPLGALDKALREEIQAEIKRIHKETGVTILYVTHDQEEALRLSDRVAVFKNGRIEQIGTPVDLYETPNTAFIGKFLGHSNFLSAKVADVAGGSMKLELPDGTTVLSEKGGRLAPKSDASIMIRPDRVSLCKNDSLTDCSIKVHIRDITYLGDTLVYNAVTSWGQPFAIRQSRQSGDKFDIPSAEEATVYWRSEDVHIFESQA